MSDAAQDQALGRAMYSLQSEIAERNRGMEYVKFYVNCIHVYYLVQGIFLFAVTHRHIPLTQYRPYPSSPSPYHVPSTLPAPFSDR